MTSEYLEDIRKKYLLTLKYGLKYKPVTNPFQRFDPPDLISKEPVNIELKPKIILALQDIYSCDFPTSLLYLLRFFRFYINSRNVTEYYFFDEGKRLCTKIKNSEQYMIIFMKECPEDYQTFSVWYDNSLKNGNDFISYSRSIHAKTSTKSHIFKRAVRYIIDQKINEFQILDAQIISIYASYWNFFRKNYIIFSDELAYKPDFVTFPNVLANRFRDFCIETHNNFAHGLKHLKRDLKDYSGTVRIPCLTPTGKRSSKTMRAYKGFKLKDSTPEAKVM